MTLARVVLILLVGLLGNPAAGQTSASSVDEAFVGGRWRDLTLTRACEPGFMRLMHMAQSGQLGDDIVNANIGVFKNHARLELVRAAAPSKRLLLIPKGSATRSSRYFDIEPDEGATAADVERIGKALDQVFDADPFELSGQFYASPDAGPIPALADAWRDGGWRNVARILQRRTVALATLPYSLAVIVALATGFAAGVLLLLGSAPDQSYMRAE